MSESKTPAQFFGAFASIPVEADTLDLSEQIYGRTSYELSEGLFSVPRTVTTIVISYNNLGMKNMEELKKIFSHLSKSVTTLESEGNGFCLPLVKFKEVLKVMKYVTLLKIKEHDADLKKMGSAEEVADMIASFTDKKFQLQGNSPLLWSKL